MGFPVSHRWLSLESEKRDLGRFPESISGVFQDIHPVNHPGIGNVQHQQDVPGDPLPLGRRGIDNSFGKLFGVERWSSGVPIHLGVSHRYVFHFICGGGRDALGGSGVRDRIRNGLFPRFFW
jgi:hypothetical protein